MPPLPLDTPDEHAPPELGKLSARQEAFVREYLVDLNGRQAAIRAGYSPEPESADVTASNLLRLPKVAAAIEQGKASRAERLNITQDKVLNEMAILANSRLEHYVIDNDGQVRLAPGAPEGAMGAIQSVKKRTTVKTDREGNTYITYDVELRLWDKPNTLKLVGRHVNLFPDRREITGKDGGPIETTVRKVEREIIDAGNSDT